RKLVAHRAGRAGALRADLVRCAVARPDASADPGREAPDASAPDLSFWPFLERHGGVRRLCDLLRAARAGVLPRRARPDALGQELFFARAVHPDQRHLRQGLYRPGPGVLALRGGALLSRG